MITDQDIEKLKNALTTKEELKEVRQDIVFLEEKIDDLTELAHQLPTKEDMHGIFERTYNFSVLKAEHDRMKEVLRVRLQVEI